MKISIAGFGAVCENAHLPAIKSIGDFEISGVFDVSEERVKKASELLNTNTYLDFDLMIENENPDVVLIATPPYSHKELILKALERGIHVLCEKPLCIKISEFDEISDLARSCEKVVFTVHNWLYSPQVKKMIELSLEIKPKYICWHTLRTKPSISASSQWRTDPSKSGGGIIFDHGWHVFYILMTMSSSYTIDLAPYFVFNSNNVDEIADLKLIYENGCVCDVHLSWQSPVRKNFCLCYGKNGYFEFLDDRIIYETPFGKGIDIFEEKISSSSAHPLWTKMMYYEFLKAMSDRSIAENNLSQASECIRIIEMAYNKFNKMNI